MPFLLVLSLLIPWWSQAAPTLGYRVVHAYPHDPGAFTQGLVYHQGLLYESTGLYGRSSLRQVILETGEVIRERRLPGHLFGEGLALCGDRLIQLTWRAGVGFVYDKRTFEPIAEFRYSGEGWGLACQGRQLVMSDGSATLRFLDPETFAVVGKVEVRDGASPVEHINELEFVEGRLWANIWPSRRIAVIDPATGKVEAWIDFGDLLPAAKGAMNGIAYDGKGKRLLVTGKLWPRLFEIAPADGGP
ncbi:MAG: glutaminyl-peptide cyclotransferase [Gammaproteobacteria bacterium]|nr:MAG: glutaminyl-peptide cyclotransferase [Gammaproteobacteria bacterium]